MIKKAFSLARGITREFTDKALISNIFAYSPNENKAKAIAEYSTLYPDTNSLSASGKSKGNLLVSARIQIKNIINELKNGQQLNNSF